MRTAVSGKANRAEALEAMAAEAGRLQERANYEARVALATYQMEISATSASREADSCSAGDGSSQEHYDDVDEPWQLETQDLFSPPAPPKSASVTEPRTPLEATVLLARYPVGISSLKDMKKLLAARADPNVIVDSNNFSLLRRVFCFARNSSV